MHLLVLFKCKQQITKFYAVHSMLMELCSLLGAQTLLQEYVFLLSTAPCVLLILLGKVELPVLIRSVYFRFGVLARVVLRKMTNRIMR
jgi:hypothetical protein